MTDESDVHSLTGAYSLDALDAVERARVERHLEDCAACAAEVRSFHETAARLGAGAAVAPPPGLRDRVMAEVAHTRQLPPTSQPTPPRNRSASRATRWLGVAASSLLVLSRGPGAPAGSTSRRATEAEAQHEQGRGGHAQPPGRARGRAVPGRRGLGRRRELTGVGDLGHHAVTEAGRR